MGIVGIVGSPIILLNNVTAVVAGVGVVLGVIALFGSKKILAAVGVVLCILAIVFTVLAQGAAVKELDKIGQQIGAPADDAAANGRTYSVGDTHRGADVDITVAAPKAFTTGEYAVPAPKAKAMSYQVTVVNHSAKPWSTAALLMQATAGSTAVEQVFDSSGDFSGTPTQDILPGKKLSFRIGFVDGPGDMTIQLSSLGGDKIFFVQKR